MKLPSPQKLTKLHFEAALNHLWWLILLSVEYVSPKVPPGLWDGPHFVCGMCFSLNKSTSYLSVCLSLNSFYDETSRTWASLSPENKSVISVGRLLILASFESQPYEFKSQAGFWPSSGPRYMGSSLKLRWMVSVLLRSCSLHSIFICLICFPASPSFTLR